MNFEVTIEWPSWPITGAIQIFDFDEMECDDYDSSAEMSYAELRNVSSSGSSGIFRKTTADRCHAIGLSNDMDIIPLPSYGSFVKNLQTKTNDCDNFESATNSTTIEDINGHEMCHSQCANDCTCQACLEIYTDDTTSDPPNVFYLENITNIDLLYDFTFAWNHVDVTTYIEFPQVTRVAQ